MPLTVNICKNDGTACTSHQLKTVEGEFIDTAAEATEALELLNSKDESQYSLIDPRSPNVKIRADHLRTVIQKEAALRAPHAARVKVFEGMTMADFERSLPLSPGSNDRGNALRLLKNSISAGNPNWIDPGQEAMAAALVFSESFPNLWPFRITREDLSPYAQEYLLETWANKKPDIKTTFELSKVAHPFAQVIDALPVDSFDRFRGLPSFNQLADSIATMPRIQESRELKVLYPGSGSHVAPLMTAIKLIDQKAIDKAQFVHTEIDGFHVDVLRNILAEGVKRGVFDTLSVKAPVTFAKQDKADGSETTLEVVYKGKPISIVFKLNRSGEDYYLEDDLKDAHLVVLHDPGVGYFEYSVNLLSQILFKRRERSFKEEQWIVMEGSNKSESTELPEEIAQVKLEGPYGHCGGVAGVGEVKSCAYSSARAFSLNDPVLQILVTNYTDAIDLSHALYQPPERVKSLSQ